MNCPSCGTGLVVSDRQGIEIDYCPSCRGVWLDRGELDKIVDRSQTEAFDRRPAYSREDDDRDRDYRSKKKKGFLGDIFDF